MKRETRQRSRPIGVFDSGVGGLTVLKALRRRLPGEDMIYFGDTAHVPYGTKSPEIVRRLVVAHMRFLLRQRVKCVVIACNTVSAVAFKEVARIMRMPRVGAGRDCQQRGGVAFVGAIGPGIREALARTRRGRIGVLGTTTTIASGAYQRALVAGFRGRILIRARACPLFVPLAEEGWADHAVARRVAIEYLSPLKAARVDVVILGCTHYPLLKRVIGRVMGSRVRLIDSAEAMGEETARLLAARGQLNGRRRGGRTVFYLTDTGGAFRRVARRFLGRPLGRLIKVSIELKALSDVQEKN